MSYYDGNKIDRNWAAILEEEVLYERAKQFRNNPFAVHLKIKGGNIIGNAAITSTTADGDTAADFKKMWEDSK